MGWLITSRPAEVRRVAVNRSVFLVPDVTEHCVEEHHLEGAQAGGEIHHVATPEVGFRVRLLRFLQHVWTQITGGDGGYAISLNMGNQRAGTCASVQHPVCGLQLCERHYLIGTLLNVSGDRSFEEIDCRGKDMLLVGVVLMLGCVHELNPSLGLREVYQ